MLYPNEISFCGFKKEHPSDSHATIKKTYFARSKVKENQDLWVACLITKLVVPKLGKLVYTMRIH